LFAVYKIIEAIYRSIADERLTVGSHSTVVSSTSDDTDLCLHSLSHSSVHPTTPSGPDPP